MSIIPHYFNSNLFFQFIKASELIMVYVNLFIALIYGKRQSLFLSVVIILSSSLNYFLKHVVAVPIFKANNDNIPIFGQGSRPLNATDCGYFTIVLINLPLVLDFQVDILNSLVYILDF